MERYLALELASTIRHDGDGGVADDLETVADLAQWVRPRAELLDLPPEFDPATALDADALAAVRALRRAVRALFARAVAPAPPSSADAGHLLPADEAVHRLNAAAAPVPLTVALDWPPSPQTPPTARTAVASGTQLPPRTHLLAALARAAIGFLGGPERGRLRACSAPRCVRYFVKSHGRQAWCKPSCGNRARVARHYQRQRGESAG